MNTKKSNKAPKIGVDRFTYALLTKDEEGSAPEYGETETVPGTVQAGFNPNAQTSSFYADNGVYATAAQTGDLVVTVGLADIPPDIRAVWYGQDYVAGLLEEGEINPPDMAIGYRVKKSSGAYRYVWLYKGKAAPPAETNDTQGSSISYQSDSITINCAKLVSRRKYRRVLDDDDPNLPQGVTPQVIAESWFTSPLWLFEPVV